MRWMFGRASEFLLLAAGIADEDRASSIPSALRANEVISGLCDFHFAKVASTEQVQTEVEVKTKDTPRHICLVYFEKTV
jgi:hypothetical protein